MLRSLWRYRTFVVSSIRSEFHARFIRNKLGMLWMVANPLAQVAVYALILSSILAAKLPGIDNPHAYAIYLTAGMLGWTLFAEGFTRSVNLFVDNAALLKKLAFPKLALPLIVGGSALLNASLLFIAIVAIFTLLGHPIAWNFLWVFPLFALTLYFALALGLILGILNVFIRDVSQVSGIVLQFWFWLTPIVYVPSIIPEAYRSYLSLNPLIPLIEGFQNALVYDRHPNLSALLVLILVSLFLSVAALWLYRKAAPEMVDLL